MTIHTATHPQELTDADRAEYHDQAEAGHAWYLARERRGFQLQWLQTAGRIGSARTLAQMCSVFKQLYPEWTSRAGEEHCGDGVRSSSPAPGAYIGPSFLLLSPRRPSGAALGPHIVKVEPVRLDI